METAPLYSTMLGQGTLDDFLNPRMIAGLGDLASQFDFLENAMSDSGPFLLGEKISCADILLFAALSWWGAAVFPSMDKMLDNRPKLSISIHAIGKIEAISNYYREMQNSRNDMPTVGLTNYSDYYKNFHFLCDIK